MKFIHKTTSYIRRHLDFLLLDLATFAVAFFLTAKFRRSIDIPVNHGGLFLIFGIVAFVLFAAADIFSHNLNGIVSRSAAREAGAIGRVMISTWCVFTAVLFLMREAHEFSRAIYIISFFACFFGIFIERALWKTLIRYSRKHETSSPELLVVCEAKRAQTVVNRILPGNFENQYTICGVVTNDGDLDYHDWYPCRQGIENISAFLKDKKVQDAYVELDNAKEEAEAIRLLLDEGVAVHRSLRDSKFHYANQHIGEISGKSVISIEDTSISLVSKADQAVKELMKKRAKKRDRNI